MNNVRISHECNKECNGLKSHWVSTTDEDDICTWYYRKVKLIENEFGHIVINSKIFKDEFLCLKCDVWIPFKYFLKEIIKPISSLFNIPTEKSKETK